VTIGVVHPGAMGAALAGALAVARDVVWASQDRSEETAARARDGGLTDVHSLRAVAESCDVIVSACPPHAAFDVAQQIARVQTGGLLYIEANSVAPQTARDIQGLFAPGVVVDAAVTGSPRLDLGETTLWLAGEKARDAARLFAGSPVKTEIIGQEVGKASAFKMCAGLRSKVIPAVWATLIDAARVYGPEVEAALRMHLGDIGYDLDEQEARMAERSAKAWRWAGEMTEAAKAMAEAGMPTGFSLAASETYERIARMPPRT
jgi:3-hydroxyisobutyrate dehydrogenase-like beta-hydroxyacid dehydrogenase